MLHENMVVIIIMGKSCIEYVVLFQIVIREGDIPPPREVQEAKHKLTFVFPKKPFKQYFMNFN